MGFSWCQNQRTCSRTPDSCQAPATTRDECCEWRLCDTCKQQVGCGFCLDNLECQWKSNSSCSGWETEACFPVTSCPPKASFYGTSVCAANLVKNVTKEACRGSFHQNDCAINPSDCFSSMNSAIASSLLLCMLIGIAAVQMLLCLVECFSPKPFWRAITMSTVNGAGRHVLVMELNVGMLLLFSGNTLEQIVVASLSFSVLLWRVFSFLRRQFSQDRLQSTLPLVYVMVTFQLVVVLYGILDRYFFFEYGTLQSYGTLLNKYPAIGCGQMDTYTRLLGFIFLYATFVVLITTQPSRVDFRTASAASWIPRPRLLLWIASLTPLLWLSAVAYSVFWYLQKPLRYVPPFFSEFTIGMLADPIFLTLYAVPLGMIQRVWISGIWKEQRGTLIECLRAVSPLCTVVQISILLLALATSYSHFGLLVLNVLSTLRTISIQYCLADRSISGSSSIQFSSNVFSVAVPLMNDEPALDIEAEETSPARRKIARVLSFLGTWKGQQLLAIYNNLQTGLTVSIGVAVGAYPADYAVPLVLVAMVGILSGVATLAGRLRGGRVKAIVPTDDGMRFTCVLKGAVLVLKSLLIGSMESRTSFFDFLLYFLLVSSLIVLTVLTLVDCRVHWAARDVFLEGVGYPRVLLANYVLGFVWVKVAVIYVTIASHSVLQSVQRKEKTVLSCVNCWWAFLMFFPMVFCAAYVNNELARFLDGRRELFGRQKRDVKATKTVEVATADGTATVCRIGIGNCVHLTGVVAVQPLLTLLAAASLGFQIFALALYGSLCDQSAGLSLNIALLCVFVARCVLMQWAASSVGSKKVPSALPLLSAVI